ncbi:MAG: hypothetical protein ACFE9L_11950 [Candidatus Hodarchaeota archaeon]
MAICPEIKNYGTFFDDFRHHLKYGVSWHEIIKQKHFFVYAIVAYTKEMGFGEKLIEEIEFLAKSQKAQTICFNNVINRVLEWILIKRNYLPDFEPIGDCEEEVHFWKDL